jgi:hypothetical protein
VLTRKEILRQLKTEKVYLGKDPNRTFTFYEERQLLPQPVGYRKSEPLYPEHTSWVIKDILFAQQIEKRTIEDIKREQEPGGGFGHERFQLLGLEKPPLNIYYRNHHHGQYGTNASDILVAIYETHLVVFLVEGVWGGFFGSPNGERKPMKILEKRVIPMDQYGAFVRDQAIGRVTGEGRVLEASNLFEALFGEHP